MEMNWSLGMRFSPNDEELIKDYLCTRLKYGTTHDGIIKELNIYDYEPWQLQSLAFKHGMYFCTPIRKKHPGGSRIDRVTKEGYWRASQSCGMVVDEDGNEIGTKRPLVYYVNNGTQKGLKTDWLMNEYMLIDQSHDMVICWIHQKKSKQREGKDNHDYPAGRQNLAQARESNPDEDMDKFIAEILNLDQDKVNGTKDIVENHNIVGPPNQVGRSQGVGVDFVPNDYADGNINLTQTGEKLSDEDIFGFMSELVVIDDEGFTLDDLDDEGFTLDDLDFDFS